MSNNDTGRRYVLGLDLGVSSIGWAIVDENGLSGNARIVRAGAHLFEAGVDGGKQDPKKAMEDGREKSRATPRRDARQQRRQTWRRAFRKRSLLKKLIRHGLLPEPEHRLASPADIDTYLKQLDAGLREAWEVKQDADHRTRQLLPYRLRAEAIRRKLEPYEVGRALYHLAQRRGFLSNRKTDDDEASDDDKNTGKVKAGISELEKLMKAADAETLGEYFASLDPSSPEHHRIRGRWTARSMYEHEFNRIWEEQSKHHSALMTDKAKQDVYRAIFFQRPLKSQRHLIGKCSLIPTKRRAPIADRLFQHFRMIQKINDLEIIPCKQIEEEDVDRKTGEVKMNPKTGKPKMKKRLAPDPHQKQRPLTAEEREAAIERLSQGDATFHQLRQAGAAPKHSRFNFEKEGENRLPGLRTDEKLRKVFGDRWDELSEDEKDAVVEDCLSIVRADVMEKRGREHWKLSAEDAKAFARVKLEEGYASYSRSALKQILPMLEDGTRLQTIVAPTSDIRKELFPHSSDPPTPKDTLPPLKDAFDDPVSPAVSRALSEMRGVVNAIIRRYGKPEHIRIELARDLKKGRKRRESISKNIADRRKLREAAAYRLLKEYPNRGSKPEDVSRDDKLKVMLADECNWICPYTGRSFGWSDVFGTHPTIDIEHIWPFKRSLDDSFINKTLCCVKENRNVKRNRMPSEVYSGDRLAEMLQRVAKFKGDAAKTKLDRFKAESIPPDFTNRHLSESRYVSRKAAEYVALLYGGYSDEEHKRRVHVPSGGLTAWLRHEWGMNAILSDRDEKDRNDHRHHAIDAIIVAKTTPATIKNLQQSAARADDAGTRRRFAGLEPPFEVEDARRAIDAIVVSHRQNKKAAGLSTQRIRCADGTVKRFKHRIVAGKIHADSIYSKPLPANNAKSGHRIRKELHKLKESEIDAIVDPRIRKVVREAYEQRKQQGATNPTKAFSEDKCRPQLPHGDRIRRVRIYTDAKPWSLGTASWRSRFVTSTPGSNHHTVIMAKLDKDGNEKTWVDEPVSLFDAMNRVKEGQPLISREVPEGYRFKFSLAANDYIEMDRKDVEGRAIYRILNISKAWMEVRQHFDGRTRKQLDESGDKREIIRGSQMYSRNARKVHVNYLGEVKNAGG